MADDDADVPERVQEAAQERSSAAPIAAAEEHEQIDVGVQTEMPAAVAAERQHGDRRAGRALGEELPQHAVDAIGIALERGAPAGAAQRRRPRARSSGIERRHERGSAGPGWVSDMP